MPLWGTTIHENKAAYFQGKPPCPSGEQQYMKINEPIFRVKTGKRGKRTARLC